MRMLRFWSVLLGFCYLISFLTTEVLCQPAVAARLPAAMLQCEQDQCTRGGGGGLWVFDGMQGEAMWRFGAVAALTVRKFDGKVIVIDRADPPGTYSSRWAGQDGYFRAIYTGVIRGNRIDGQVVWNGNTAHPGTWYATMTDSPCSPGSACPLSIDQVRQLGQRAQEAKLFRSAAVCSKIAGDVAVVAQSQKNTSNTGGNAVTVTSGESESVCKSHRVRGAMQELEDREMKDPNGAILALLACGVTGVCGEQGRATVVDSASGSDGGKYTSKDPGSFACRGLFLRGKVDTSVLDEEDGEAQLTKDALDKLMAKFPHFIEWYKVKPLGDGHYKLTLLPTSVQLSKEYSEEFIYP